MAKFSGVYQQSPELVLTKMDVMGCINPIKLCVAYIYRGPEVEYAGCTLRDGDEITDFIRLSGILSKCEPVYIEMEGWTEDISGCREYEELPLACRKIVGEIERRTGGIVRIISVGAERDAIIVR